jgi:thiol-disulfide isomerase/thioredoxin
VRISRPVSWSIAAVVVVVAVAIAVWPRGHAAANPAPAPDLTSARAAADLAGCTTPATHATDTALAAVHVTCMADGKGVDLGTLLGGRPALVNVWASWCVPCQQELPALDAYAAQPGALPVIGVQVQSAQADGLSLLSSLKVHRMPMLYDTGGAAGRALHLPVGLPVSYLVKANGSATVITKPSRVLDSVAMVKQAVTTYLGGAG